MEISRAYTTGAMYTGRNREKNSSVTDLEGLARLLVQSVEVSLGQSEQILGVAIDNFERKFLREQLQRQDIDNRQGQFRKKRFSI